MFRQLVIVGLLFAVGVSFGAVVTPVGIEVMHHEQQAPEQLPPRPHSNTDEDSSYLS